MALEQSIVLAVAPSNDYHLHITNTNEKYTHFECHVDAVRYFEYLFSNLIFNNSMEKLQKKKYLALKFQKMELHRNGIAIFYVA